jgi:hypothetical protein
MRTLAWCLCVALVLLLPSATRADEISVVPMAGWAWGGTQEFDIPPFRGDVHIDASPAYGIALAAYGREYGAELAYDGQWSEALVRVDGLGELGRVDLSVQYILLQVLRQYPHGPWIPFLMAGAGGAALRAVDDTSWEVGLTLGAGLRRKFSNGCSLRLMARFLAPVPIEQGGFSFGASGTGLGIGGAEAIYQGDVSLGVVFPLWQRR